MFAYTHPRAIMWLGTQLNGTSFSTLQPYINLNNCVLAVIPWKVLDVGVFIKTENDYNNLIKKCGVDPKIMFFQVDSSWEEVSNTVLTKKDLDKLEM